MVADLRTLMIVNPRAGGGVLGRRWPAVAALVARELGAFQQRFSSGPGDATELARRALAEDYDQIVAVGGDGTVNEVVNGMLREAGSEPPAAALGVLHFGTGGDFCRAAGIPRGLRQGVRALATGRSRAIDVGRVSFTGGDGRPAQRFFANVASFGMSGVVDEIVNQGSKALGGRLSFALATLKAMRRYRAPTATLRYDDEALIEATIHNVAIANGQFFGGGMRIAPPALLDDGLLDVVVLSEISLLELLKHGHRVYRGTHLQLPFVTHRHARRVEALPAHGMESILLDVDGETPGRLPATFEVVPAALRLICPPWDAQS